MGVTCVLRIRLAQYLGTAEPRGTRNLGNQPTIHHRGPGVTVRAPKDRRRPPRTDVPKSALRPGPRRPELVEGGGGASKSPHLARVPGAQRAPKPPPT